MPTASFFDVFSFPLVEGDFSEWKASDKRSPDQ